MAEAVAPVAPPLTCAPPPPARTPVPITTGSPPSRGREATLLRLRPPHLLLLLLLLLLPLLVAAAASRDARKGHEARRWAHDVRDGLAREDAVETSRHLLLSLRVVAASRDAREERDEARLRPHLRHLLMNRINRHGGLAREAAVETSGRPRFVVAVAPCSVRARLVVAGCCGWGPVVAVKAGRRWAVFAVGGPPLLRRVRTRRGEHHPAVACSAHECGTAGCPLPHPIFYEQMN